MQVEEQGCRKELGTWLLKNYRLKSFQVGGDDFSVIQGLNIPFTNVINIKSTFEIMMFGRCSAFHALPQVRGIVQGLAGKIN